MASGLYIHVPFCVRKCPYCDFYSVSYRPHLLSRYCQALKAEIKQTSILYESYRVDTVYFGGGTPSLLQPDQVEGILSAVAEGFELAQGAEVTLEANPGTFDEAKAQGFRVAGVNRISLGLQSLDDGLLQVLGRMHTAADACHSVERCRRAGFNNLNLDLIYGIPGQTGKKWESTLCMAMSLEPTHISAYLLQLEPETPLGQRIGSGETSLLSEELELEQYEMAIDVLNGGGYYQYEISNFAQPDYACRHNLHYWEGDEYLGLGPGAVSCTGGRRYRNQPDVRSYLECIEQGQTPPKEQLETLEGRSLIQDRLILGLRLTRGVSRSQFQHLYGVDILDDFSRPWARGEAAGLLETEGERVRLTRKGYFLSNEVFRELLG